MKHIESNQTVKHHATVALAAALTVANPACAQQEGKFKFDSPRDLGDIASCITIIRECHS